MTTQKNPKGTPKHLQLHEAVHQGDLKRVLVLLAQGAPVNAQAAELKGATPLHVACYLYGQAEHTYYHAKAMVYAEIAATLLTAGADVTARDQQFRVPSAMCDGFQPACMRNAMTRKAVSKPGVFAFDWLEGENGDWLMADHALQQIEPWQGGLLRDSGPARCSPAMRQAYNDERAAKLAAYETAAVAGRKEARRQEIEAGRQALLRMGLGQAMKVPA